MNIFYHISPFPALAEDMVAKVYEAQSPNAVVDSQVIPAPHSAPVSVTFNGLDKVTHIVRLFSATTNTLLHEYDVEPTADTVTIFDPIQFKIGDGGANTPVALTTDYINSDLAGLAANEYLVYRRGSGFLTEGVEYGNNPVIGGFSLIIPGDRFDDQEEFLIQRIPKVLTTVVNDSVVGKQWGPGQGITDMFVDINTPTDYDPAHLRKLIRLSGVAAEYKFPLALGTDVPIGYVFRFINFGVEGESGKVIFENATLLWGSTPKAEIEVPFSATVEFVFDGTNWSCTMFNSIPAAVTAPAAIITYVGTKDIGDVGVVHDQIYSVAIPDQGVNTYRVLGSIEGYHANWDNDNDSLFTIHDKQTTSFKVSIKRLASTAHNLKFAFAIIK